MNPFAEFVDSRLRNLGMTRMAFAKMVGRSDGNISNILNGSRERKTQFRPPLDEMERWAEALDLTAEGRDELVELAELAHTPDRIRERYLTMKAQLGTKRESSPAQQRKAGRMPYIPTLPDESEAPVVPASPALTTSDDHG